jgi:NDP-sugar pyrophosphorylase family protein
MRGLILSAGLGTRLYPLTLFRSKPAIPFLNRPLIQYSLDLLLRSGIDQVAVNLHHLPETVKSALQGHKSVVLYSYEPEILGTAGGIGKIREFLVNEDTFVVTNGKIYIEGDLKEAIRFHQQSGAMATLVLVPFKDSDRFNPVYLDDRNNIERFGLLRQGESPENGFVFTGIHILQKDILRFIPEGVSDTIRDVYPRLIGEGFPVRGFVTESYWCETSTLVRYLDRSFEVLARKQLRRLVQSRFAAPEMPLIAGECCHVEPDVILNRCILWDSVVVGRGSRLRNVIIGSDANIPPGTVLENAAVTPLVENDAVLSPRGVVRGETYIYPLEV